MKSNTIIGCKHPGCPFRIRPCPDHDGEHTALFAQRKTVFHRETWPVTGPGYDRRLPRPAHVIPIISREDRETRRIEDLLKERGYDRPRIGGYTLTYHATARMIVRQINRASIENALTQPRITTSTRVGGKKLTGSSAMCVVNHSTKEIVTIGYGLDYEDKISA
ncbi:MAG: hypothetical protein E6Q97_25260 [Desulfurellales bacterium]|nr:MAG: hypothetical protein E6Q97_25260 [Desulfurellales bacterium]